MYNISEINATQTMNCNTIYCAFHTQNNINRQHKQNKTTKQKAKGKMHSTYTYIHIQHAHNHPQKKKETKKNIKPKENDIKSKQTL